MIWFCHFVKKHDGLVAGESILNQIKKSHGIDLLLWLNAIFGSTLKAVFIHLITFSSRYNES